MSVEGYFRLVAKDWSYNGTSETLLLGRMHKAVDNDTDFISIGEMKTLSRKHAIIKWHSELGKWTITVRQEVAYRMDVRFLCVYNLY